MRRAEPVVSLFHLRISMNTKRESTGTGSTLHDVALDAILNALNSTGSKSAAARQLRISRATAELYIRRGFTDGRKFRIEEVGLRKYKVIREEST